MALNEPNPSAIRRGREERTQRITNQHSSPKDRFAKALAFLENEVWPEIPAEVRGRGVTKGERAQILG